MLKLGGGPSFLTEFGVCSFNSENELNTNECEIILDNCDHFQTSWTYWDSNFYQDNFEINKQLVAVFSRVYPKYTNGIPISLSFSLKTGKFIYIFEMNLNDTNLNTEIFVPNHVYPNGFDVLTSDQLLWTFNSVTKIIYLKLKANISINFNKFFIIIFKK
jgi:hypothetical protein